MRGRWRWVALIGGGAFAGVVVAVVALAINPRGVFGRTGSGWRVTAISGCPVTRDTSGSSSLRLLITGAGDHLTLDPGDPSVARGYFPPIRRHNVATTAALDSFVRAGFRCVPDAESLPALLQPAPAVIALTREAAHALPDRALAVVAERDTLVIGIDLVQDDLDRLLDTDSGNAWRWWSLDDPPVLSVRCHSPHASRIMTMWLTRPEHVARYTADLACTNW